MDTGPVKLPAAVKKHRADRLGISRVVAADTGESILAAARTVLLREGYERFTTRKVAQVAGITLGNLTYHFPSKRELLASLIRRVLAEYSQAIEGFFADLSVPLDRKFEALIVWLMDEATTAEANSMFRQVWALALHDRHIASAVDDFYDEAMARIAQLLRFQNQALKPGVALTIAHLLAAISEGTGVIYGTRTARAASHGDVKAMAVELLCSATRSAAHRSCNGTGANTRTKQAKAKR